MEIISNQEPRFTSAKELAYYKLKESILNLELYPNQLIVEEKLAEKLNVSRTPLREALFKLQFNELIVKQLNGRFKVASISVKEAKEIFQVRIELEGIIVREATEKATEKDLENLQIIVNTIQLMTKEKNMDKILLYGEKFHFYLYEISENNTIKTILLQLNNHIKRYRALVPANKKILIDKDEEHSLIFEYIKKGKKEKADEMMKKHLEDSLQVAIKTIEKFNKNNNI